MLCHNDISYTAGVLSMIPDTYVPITQILYVAGYLA